MQWNIACSTFILNKSRYFSTMINVFRIFLSAILLICVMNFKFATNEYRTKLAFFSLEYLMLIAFFFRPLSCLSALYICYDNVFKHFIARSQIFAEEVYCGDVTSSVCAHLCMSVYSCLRMTLYVRWFIDIYVRLYVYLSCACEFVWMHLCARLNSLKLLIIKRNFLWGNHLLDLLAYIFDMRQSHKIDQSLLWIE